jgi:hypothetical protein
VQLCRRPEERFADAELHRARLGVGEDLREILGDRAARSDEQRDDDDLIDAVGLGLCDGAFEDDRGDAAEEGGVDLGRVHRRDRMDFLPDELADFLGQPSEGQGRRRFVGTIIDEEDARAGHGA